MALATAAAGLAAAAYLNGRYQLKNDLTGLYKLKKAERAYQKRLKEGTLSPWYILAETCARQPQDRAIWTRERYWTFQELHDQVTRYSQWLLEYGIQPGDLVAMYLHNSAEFLFIFFATLCIGAGPALINYNLEGKALSHCLGVCNSKLLIIDPDDRCQQRIETSRSAIEAVKTSIVTLDAVLRQAISMRPVVVPTDELRRGMKPEFPYALIYTSGTTGTPKGCPFVISRTHLLGAHLEPAFGAVRGIDCWYNPMPLYHGTGLITSSIALLGGIGVAIAPRFSVMNFWRDIHDSQSTMFIYVGETARYLLAAPPDPLEREHQLRMAYGNGLRPDIWDRFQERFNIPEIGEFFNSSEGLMSTVVWCRNPYYSKCVGQHGLFWRTVLHKVYVPVRFDPETGDIWRDPQTGFAQRVTYEEGGEILVAVPSRAAFGGYWNNPEATNKRFATDVFKAGDLYYRSGDSLRRDGEGRWYFLDRLGDTFRWKSENVSTAEVSEVLGKLPGILEANVYGVAIPGYEGRAGCAALHLDEPSTPPTPEYFASLLEACRAQLPRYAVPVFLRVVKRSSHIHNNKQNKVGLRQEGVDPEKTGTLEKEGREDGIWWWKPGTAAYLPFEARDWQMLVGGQARL